MKPIDKEKNIPITARPTITEKTTSWDLMKLADDQDCEAYEAADIEQIPADRKRKYRDFYNDVKQPCDYIKEDW